MITITEQGQRAKDLAEKLVRHGTCAFDRDDEGYLLELFDYVMRQADTPAEVEPAPPTLMTAVLDKWMADDVEAARQIKVAGQMMRQAAPLLRAYADMYEKASVDAAELTSARQQEIQIARRLALALDAWDGGTNGQ